MIPLFRLNKLRPSTISTYLQKNGARQVYIYSQQHSAYWRSNRMGYTYHVEAAGIYTLNEAYNASGHCDEGKGIHYITVNDTTYP